MQQNNSKHKFFQRLGLITLVAVYLLILVGGIVRTTGSGMGCPDWPKCFGNWVPPTEETQLPENYREIYAQKRAAKNERFAKYLDFFGFENKADQIRNDESILVERKFNKYKTWTEYVNRLTGTTIGLLMIATMLASLAFRKKDKTIVALSVGALLMTIFEGWIGSIVVSTNLMPWMITVHMLLALLIVALLLYAIFRAYREQRTIEWISHKRSILNLLILSIVVYLVQIVLGTQVREMVDVVAEYFGLEQRALWIDQLGIKFKIHRSYSILVLGMHVWLLVLLFKYASHDKPVMKWAKVLLSLIVLEIIVGIIMAYFAIPAFAQPVHLLLASVIFGIQIQMWLMIRGRKVVKRQEVVEKVNA